MLDSKIISPLLDGFTIGTPISEHHGVVCCPAIKENSNKKYIVKQITVPATQAQFDALLLAGAYKDPGDAMEYFRENGECILKEAELLKTLSKIEGFLPYEGWQMEPITRRRLGYEIYLVGSYKRSLEKYIRKNAVTHLEAVNMALDLCAALSLCRQSGYLYADLKPNNIFVSEKKEYRIGDLGFLNLETLRYASLPERYFSPYTPPELMDPMAPINLTVDTYAVGMILYQLYNDGRLPVISSASDDERPTPCNADYEMAEIIMKAIHTDPERRWNDPKDLGKAIASYMQRNSINDIPITPFIPLDVKPEDIIVLSPEKTAKENPVIENTEAQYSLESDAHSENEAIVTDSQSESVQSDTLDATNVNLADDVNPKPNAEDASDSQIHEDAISPSLLIDHSTDSPDGKNDETAVLEEISEEVAKIVSKANDIIAHEIPEETAFPTIDDQPDLFAFASEDYENDSELLSVNPDPEENLSDPIPVLKNKAKHFENTARKEKIKKFFFRCFAFILLIGSSAGGFWYYQNVYLQTIDSISITGSQTQMTVLIDTSIEESRLTVHCVDEKGKQRTEAVHGGKVIFSDLSPSTQYTIQLDMAGFHKLVGHTSEVFTTESTTQVISFEAIAGSEDGSVKLEFTVDGNEPDFWNIRYTADGEDERVETVTAHSAMISGLTIGKTYTFTLDGGSHFDLGGKTSLQYLASKLILAEDLTATSSNGNEVTVQWRTPGDVIVESWNVRCYDGYNFEVESTVTENSVLFTGLDTDSHYTVEVTAAGMTRPSTLRISTDPIVLSGFRIDADSKTELKISWDYTGNQPEGGWLLQYSADGSGSQTVPCEKTSAKIAPLIPGANYTFTLLAADERTVFNSTTVYQAKDAEAFKEHNFNMDNVSFNLLKTPEDANWSFETISDSDLTDIFQVGDSASLVMQSSSTIYTPSNKVKALFVFRNSYGSVMTELVTEQTLVWKDIWMTGDTKVGEIDIPTIPSVPGAYQMDLYFNGGLAATFDITITD